MKLISMIEFVLEQSIKRSVDNWPIETEDYFNRCEAYANFLKQPLNLGMFVPCDLEGNVLSEPDIWKAYQLDVCRCNKCIEKTLKCDEYQEAKGRVLFEGFVYNTEDELLERIESDGGLWTIDVDDLSKHTIEDMIQCDMILTPNSVKQLGL
ncbi:hypothetical protein [Myroides odoratimimus]|uniref:hypothetical protein n=1 Tax=Myroides odoratimimus TaxID=76832 RepID=UPI0029C03384|nr:hypothetical protein [Myroides odoratimimus]MDX4973696.1 hypothetical protein [Myroides odoratimimus]